MTTEDAAIREVEQAIAEERQSEFLQRYAPMLIAAGSVVVLGVGGWQYYHHSQSSRAEKAAAEYQTATETLTTSPEDGRVALEAFSETAPAGYAAMSDLRRAASLADSGDRAGALALLRKLYDGDAPKRLKQFARLRAAVIALPDGRDAVMSDLGSLTDEKGAFGFYARELANVAALQAKDYEAAYSGFKTASEDVAAPEPVRQRAAEYAALAASGKAGVNLTGEIKLEDLAKALGGAAAGGTAAAPAADGAAIPAPAGQAAANGEAPAPAVPDDNSNSGKDQ